MAQEGEREREREREREGALIGRRSAGGAGRGGGRQINELVASGVCQVVAGVCEFKRSLAISLSLSLSLSREGVSRGGFEEIPRDPLQSTGAIPGGRGVDRR